MLFSRAGRDARVRKLGLMRGRDENQVQLRARLAKLQRGPVDEQTEGGQFSRAASSASVGADAGPTSGNKRRMILHARGKHGQRTHLKDEHDHGDFNPRAHPLWYPGANVEWFRPCHTDRHGRQWCEADAAAVMAAGARGFLTRKRQSAAAAAARRIFESVYAIRIQRCYRVGIARKRRKQVLGGMAETAQMQLKRCARAMVSRKLLGDEISELGAAASKIQRKFRSRRMKGVVRRVLDARLTVYVLILQRAWREHTRWVQWNQHEEERVFKAAAKFKHAFLNLIKAPELAGKGPKAVRELRHKSLEAFHENTDIIGRQRAFRTLKQAKSGGDFGKVVSFRLRDAFRVTAEQVLELHDSGRGELKDPHRLDLIFQDCVTHEQKSLDLSTDPSQGDSQEKLTRWPFGLQGNHGMFRLTALNISHNELVGLPLDFYRLTNLQDLRAHHNKLKVVSSDLSNLQQLKLMWMHNNMLANLPLTISTLTNLNQLSLDHNRLNSLPTSLGFLTQMAQLRVEHNPLQSPPVEILRTVLKPPDLFDFSIVLRYLRHLHSTHSPTVSVNSFGINAFPTVLNPEDSQGGLRHLRTIQLIDNRISEIPKWFYSLTLLTCIRLDDNRINRISSAVRRMTDLNELSLRRNRLKQNGLPVEALLSLTALKILDLNLNLTLSPPAEVLRQDVHQIFRFMTATHAVDKGDDSLHLTDFRLKVFPKANALKHIRNLNLADNVIRDFPMQILTISKLDDLNLSNNLLCDVPAEISRLVQIRRLSLQSNNLTRLPDEVGNLEDLVDLDVSSNQLVALPETMAPQKGKSGGLRYLRQLCASRNKLRTLPRGVSSMASLWKLNLDYNNLDSLPDSFEGLAELKTLSLDANNLRTLPPSIGRLLCLQEFTATKNGFAGMLPSVAKLPNLKRFSLSDNCVRTLPKTLGSMEMLSYLDLERNEMETLAPLHMLKNLEVLKLKRNFIRLIPPEVEKLVKLKEFDISENQLVGIAAELRFLTNLAVLDLSNNQLISLPPCPPQVGPVFGKLISLQKLNVRKNQLCDLPLDFWECTLLTDLNLQGNPWTGNPKLKRIVSPHSLDAGGELIVKIIEGCGLAKMDGRSGMSDPYLTIRLDDGKRVTKFQTPVIQGTLNPKWNQIFRFDLDDNPFDDALEIEVLDWDLETDDDTMGHFSVPLTRELLHSCRCQNAEDGDSGPASVSRHFWYDLKGVDDLGRTAQGRVRIAFEFVPLDGSVQSVRRYMKHIATRGWLDMVEMTQAEQMARHAVKARTPHPLDGEWEHDELRHRDEIRRADDFSDGIKDWLWTLGRERERWEDMEIFYLPPGMINKPWELNKQLFEAQFEDMKGYMRKKEVEDSKNFTARRQRALERAAEKEARRAEYDPEGFFRPENVPNHARVAISRPASGVESGATSARSNSSTGTTAALQRDFSKELMKKDSWDRYSKLELRDDLFEFCRDDFEFENQDP